MGAGEAGLGGVANLRFGAGLRDAAVLAGATGLASVAE